MKIKGFKGFDKDFRCRGYQYEPGKSYETDKAKACCSGFHFCEHPLDVFRYYAPSESRFAEVEGDGDLDHHNDDTKVSCTKITIGAEINFSVLAQAAVKFVFDRVDWKNSKDKATGGQGAASATGYRGAASVEGDKSIACGLGYECKARGKIGCWIVLAERDDKGNILFVKAAKVDGKKIKEMKYYELVNGKFIEVGA
jgi:hypothetical protein